MAEPTWCVAARRSCDCLVINPHNAAANQTIGDIVDWEWTQATLQFSFAVASVLCGACYLCLFLLRPKEMWRFPQSLAFWIYASDLVKSLSLAIVSGTLLHYRSTMPEPSPKPFIVTWHADCLCASGGDQHPGCACKNGILAFMLQAGLVGSVAFYLAVLHNFWRSVLADPPPHPQPHPPPSTLHPSPFTHTLTLTLTLTSHLSPLTSHP